MCRILYEFQGACNICHICKFLFISLMRTKKIDLHNQISNHMVDCGGGNGDGVDDADGGRDDAVWARATNFQYHQRQY